MNSIQLNTIQYEKYDRAKGKRFFNQFQLTNRFRWSAVVWSAVDNCFYCLC